MSSGIVGLLILLLCIVLFITEWLPSVVTGALGCLLMVLFHVCELSNAFSGFASSIIYLLFGAMIVGNAMFETGAAALIGRQVIRLSRDNERLFLFISGLTAGCLSMFLANTATIAAFLPIVESVCSNSSNMKRKNLTMNIAICAMIGGSSTLIGCTPQLTANALLEQTTGLHMSMFTMFGPGFCMLLLYLAGTQLFGYNLGKKIWSDRPEEAMELENTNRKIISGDGNTDHKKITIMFVILGLMVLFYVTEWLSTAMTAMCAAMLCILTGCTNTKSIRKNMDWDTILFLAFCLGLADALNTGGSGKILADVASSFLGSCTSPMIVYGILCFLTLILSNFITNSTAILIVLPIGFSIGTAMGLNPMTVCLGIYFAASLACSTPLAAAQISMTLVAGYKFSDYLKYTLPHALIQFLCIWFLIPLFFPLV